MKVAVVKETFPGERRVALVPAVLKQLNRTGIEVVVESGAGQSAGYEDREYEENGAKIVGSRQEAFQADAISQVRCLGANPEAGQADLDLLRKGHILLGSCDPLGNPQAIQQLADRGVTLLALEMIPRITRAQSMDVLSSMATIAGYRAVLLGAVELPKMFPLMMTAAGTVSPARVFVIGAGVAGLQAIATSRRLGAVVHAYDVRPAVREQVESLGGKFVELQLEADESEDKGGYAKAMGEEFYQKQREFMAEVAAESDVVITTAAIPGKQSPLLITESAVRGMSRGSVIIDLAAERGGNCELAEPDQRVEKYGVTILGPTNLPSEIPYHASQMYSKNMATLLSHLVNEGQLQLDMTDEINRNTTVAHQGDVCNNRIREILGLDSLPDPVEEKESAGHKT
jgi:NAD(P) transhydrogenase subunit alpha